MGLLLARCEDCTDHRQPCLVGPQWVREEMNLTKLLIRMALGLIFSLLLSRLFFPSSGKAMVIIMALCLVFFAYVFEAARSREN